MPDFDTRKPQEPNEPSGHRIALIADKLRSSLMANRLRALLIGGGILLAVVAVGVGLLLYRSGGTDALRQGLLHEAPNGKIAFVRDIPNDYGTPVGNVFVMNADGTGERNLTQSTTAGENQPVWSPDGEKIAFVREDNDTYSRAIYVMQSDGSNLTLARDFSQGIGEIEDHHTGTMRPDWRSPP